MRIKTFCKFIEISELEDHTLNNSTVVIDGQNVLYRMYKRSNLPYKFGCESDKYAAYLKKYLKLFKDANIKVYFIFKGGHKDIDKRMNKLQEKNKTFLCDKNEDINPIFKKDIYKEVLDEMGFQYTISEFESKEDIITLARKLNCPVISFDVEYCFSSVPYIPQAENFNFENIQGELSVGVFKLEKFLQKYNLTKEKLAIFLTLSDENIFGEDFFLSLYDSLKMPRGYFKRHYSLLKWLGRISAPQAFNIIYKFVDKENFTAEMTKTLNFIDRRIPEGIPVNYLSEREKFQFVQNDPDWFQKGIALGHIAIQYINLYYSNIIFGSWAIEKDDGDDSLFFSIEMIKYAFNLLTNYTKSEFIFCHKNGSKVNIVTDDSNEKPKYTALDSPFENGWDSVKKFRLFEHFLEKSFQGFNVESLKTIPEDAVLLIISLIYFSRKKDMDTDNIVCSVLLSYIMLGIASDEADEDSSILSDSIRQNRPVLEPTTDKSLVTSLDCAIAKKISYSYFEVTDIEANNIFDQELIHPLVEFQHCLTQMNNLNRLCGTTLTPTKFSKTYNGTFVYKLVHAMEDDEAKGVDFINKLMNPAPTVLSFFNGIYDIYQTLMFR